MTVLCVGLALLAACAIPAEWREQVEKCAAREQERMHQREAEEAEIERFETGWQSAVVACRKSRRQG